MGPVTEESAVQPGGEYGPTGKIDVNVDVRDHVGIIEMRKPPHNFLTPGLIEAVAAALQALEDDLEVRAVVLAAAGRSFCAGANFSAEPGDSEGIVEQGGDLSPVRRLYAAAYRIFSVSVPVVAAVHGPAVGGGLGLAMAANLRVTCPEARFSANFVRLGIHQGFGLSVTLPELLGPSKAALVLLTGRRFNGEEATELGLADLCVPQEQVRQAAMDLAGEIAVGAPMALRAVNSTLRAGLAGKVREATDHEARKQEELLATEDALEGIAAVMERRPGNFKGR
ncbi:MAG: enoyl-CoA hydratase/isomerase family protein [Acidimicrobiales bacterium]